MGGLFNIIGVGLKYLFALVGLAIWLGGAGLAVFYGLDAIGGGGFASLEKIGGYVSIAGLLIALIGSVILLRVTGKLVPFLLCVAFGAAAWLGGNSSMFPAAKMSEASPPAATMPAPSAAAPSSPGLDAGAPPTSAEDIVRASPGAPPIAAPGSLASRGPASVDQEVGATEQDEKSADKGVLAAPRSTGATPKAEQFQLAELRFNKPNEMRLRHAYTVSATIGAPGADLPQGLGDVGPTVTRETEITRKVRVELISSDFKIEKLHTVDTVLITPKTPGQWSWKVTPLNEGPGRKLLLQVYGVIEEGGVAQGEALIKTYEETIPVTVTPMDRVSQVVDTIISSWQTIAGIAGVIGGIWVFLGNLGKALRGRKEPVTA